jgi:subtilisin family serine protease
VKQFNMKQLNWMSFSVAAIVACAPATQPTTTAPAPVPVSPTPVSPTPPAAAPTTTAPTAPTVAPTSGVREAPVNWQLLDDSLDHYPGISLVRAERELLAGKTPQKTVLVAVIDGGVDTAHTALRSKLWTNPREIAGNHKDDDGNGHVDDVHGWNFIGGTDGRDVNYDTFELTRMYSKCEGAPATISEAAMPPVDSASCVGIVAAYQRKKADINGTLAQVRQIDAVMKQVLPMLQTAIGSDSLTVAKVTAYSPSTPQLVAARGLYLQLADRGITAAAIQEAVTDYSVQSKYGLDPAFDPRGIVGDDYADVSQRNYGNTDVTGPDAKHGTHVAGIIAGAPQPNGVEGIAQAARIMPVRAVPNGDERDKDIANAIRYAVDNGARVINMSFGKPYSPFKSTVDDAIKYADAHGVLMVIAAGNDGASLDTASNFPAPAYTGGGRAANWIEVGASSWRGGDTVATSFSNYSHDKVDVFAPGENILSTVQGGGYERLSGTSMAAPVVTGLAALIMSYYPDLSAAQVRQIILDSATPINRGTIKPGDADGEVVPFKSLSVTGGIVNAYNALKLAASRSGAH